MVDGLIPFSKYSDQDQPAVKLLYEASFKFENTNPFLSFTLQHSTLAFQIVNLNIYHLRKESFIVEMKPKSRRSIESDPANVRRLSTCMKPSLRSKSNEAISNCVQKKSPVADQLLNASKGLNRSFSRVNLQERFNSISRQRGTSNLIINRAVKQMSTSTHFYTLFVNV